MKHIFDRIQNNPLFNNIDFSAFDKMYACLDAKPVSYKKNETILYSGNPVNFVGLILSGSVKILKEDANGNTNIVTELFPPDLFAEAFACAGVTHSPVTVTASEDAEILFINYKKIVTSCSSACIFHTQLIENMLRVIANKNMQLNQKIEILSKRSTREKLLVFLNLHKGTAKKFTIPYNREELAQYLCVDRSAMSNELCKMRDEGLIQFQKNEFELL